MHHFVSFDHGLIPFHRTSLKKSWFFHLDMHTHTQIYVYIYVSVCVYCSHVQGTTHTHTQLPNRMSLSHWSLGGWERSGLGKKPSHCYILYNRLIRKWVSTSNTLIRISSSARHNAFKLSREVRLYGHVDFQGRCKASIVQVFVMILEVRTQWYKGLL